MAGILTRLVHSVVLPVARRLLSNRAKHFLKRFWDPRSTVSRKEMAVLRRELRRDAKSSAGSVTAATFDIVCYSVFDWAFRFQRPQQLMSELARQGHRVFYVTLRESPSARPEITVVAPNVTEVALPHRERLNRYAGAWPPDVVQSLVAALEDVRREHFVHSAVSIVQLPTWAAVAIQASERFGWPLFYDCMDDWSGMPNVTPAIRDDEERLADRADGIIVSSETLRKRWPSRSRVTVVRNGADFDRFHEGTPSGLLSGIAHPVIGYYGAIADWFDEDLVAQVAAMRPQYSFVLVGRTEPAQERALQGVPNIRLFGEKPYALMPAYLAEFDVCMIPFRLNDVTRATDPVKLYEYFSMGKPVVATPMAELESRRHLMYLAAGATEFAAALDEAVVEQDEARRQERVELARNSSWSSRAAAMRSAIVAASPLISIIVVTWNNLELTKMCLDSVMTNTLEPRFEVVVIDNASTDGTVEYLNDRAASDSRIRVILNETNEGFAAANNRGIAAAGGQFIILLNNDTVVPPGWSARLVRHASQPQAGIVVAVTNFSGNESRIDVTYTTLEAMEQFALERAKSHDGESFDIGVAAMYCVAMRRDVLDAVGPLDERFSIGMFEDDDYSHRVRIAGYRVLCAEDAFVHHFGQASFKKLPQADYFALFERNRALYEEKWGQTWVPHKDRA